MFEDQEKGLGLKCNENCRKDEWINEHVRLTTRKYELDKVLNKYRNEILRIMSFDANNFLDGRKHGILA